MLRKHKVLIITASVLAAACLVSGGLLAVHATTDHPTAKAVHAAAARKPVTPASRPTPSDAATPTTGSTTAGTKPATGGSTSTSSAAIRAAATTASSPAASHAAATVQPTASTPFTAASPASRPPAVPYLTGINPTAAPTPPTPVPPATPAVQPLPPTASGDATVALDPSAPSTSVVVSWPGVFSDPTSPIAAYEVAVTVSGGAQVWHSAGMATTLTVTGLTPGTAYSVWVEAINADGETAPVSGGWVTTAAS